MEEIWSGEDSDEKGKGIKEADNGRGAEVRAITAGLRENSTRGLGHNIGDKGYQSPEEGLP